MLFLSEFKGVPFRSGRKKKLNNLKTLNTVATGALTGMIFGGVPFLLLNRKKGAEYIKKHITGTLAAGATGGIASGLLGSYLSTPSKNKHILDLQAKAYLTKRKYIG